MKSKGKDLHRVMEIVWERPPGDLQFNFLPKAALRLPLDQVSCGFVQLWPENLQGWRFYIPSNKYLSFSFQTQCKTKVVSELKEICHMLCALEL